MKKSIIKQYKQIIWNKKVLGSIVVVVALVSAGVFGLNGYFGGGEKGVPEDTMTRGLVAAYNFDEGSGQTAYNAADTGSVNNGTLGSSASADTNDPAWNSVGRLDSASGGDPTSSAAGPSGTALSFDGTDDYVNCGHDSSLNITDEITVEAWVKPTLIDGTVDVITRRGGSSNVNWLLRINSTNKFNFYAFIPTAHQIDGTTTPVVGTWYHVVGTYKDGDGIKIYVNGILEDTNASPTGAISTDTNDMYIGQNTLDAAYFHGTIDGVKIYNRALSAEEVRYHYNRGGPVSHWKFDEGEGSTAFDSTDNNNDGTLHLGSSGNIATSSAWTTGRYGTALEFDGTDDYVEVPDHSSLDITGGITLAAWINDPPPESFAQLEELEQELEEELTKPTILNALVDPTKVQPGDVMLVRAEIKDNYGIESVRADMGEIETIDLELKEGTIHKGTWQAEWLVHDTEIKNYITTITATNIEGLSSSVEVGWSDPTWTSPSAIQSDSGATNPGNLIDGYDFTYAYHMTPQLHYVVFDMGQDYSVSGVRCFTNDEVQTHRIYVSADTSFSDEEIVSTDHCFPNMSNGWTEKTFSAKSGRYIKFEIYRTGICTTTNDRWFAQDFYEFEAYCAAGNSAPDAPTLSSPSNGATGQSLTLDLVFNYFDTEADRCTKFDLKVDNDSGFTSPEINETDYSTGAGGASGGTITYSVSSGLSGSTKYYWKVRVYDGASWSVWSSEDSGIWDFTTLVVYNKIVSKGDDAYSLVIDGNLNVFAYVNNQSITTPITKQWHYVVSTYDGSTQKLYVDGILKASASLSGAITTNATNIKIGEKVPGKIDDIKIYDYARSPDEIRLDYNAGFAARFGPADKTCSEDPASCMDNGLVASYDFDEGDGQTAYNAADTGSVNNGTLGSSSSADSADPTWTTGALLPAVASGGGGLDFDGQNDYVEVASNADLIPSTYFTYGAWFKIDNASDYRKYIMAKASSEVASPDNIYALRGGWSSASTANVTCAVFDSSVWKTVEYDSDLHDGDWHNTVCVIDGNNLKMYVDGVYFNSISITGYIFSGSGDLHIGASWDATNCFRGKIDEVKIYNRALSAEEVRYHYNRGGPVAHWKFDEGAGSTLYDSTDNNNDGTLHLGSSGNTATSSAWVAGKHGSAIEFDGVDDYVEVPDHSSLDITGAITLAAWINDPPPEPPEPNNQLSITTNNQSSRTEQFIELQKPGIFHYGAKAAKNIQNIKPLIYSDNNKSISFRPVSLQWTNNQNQHTFIQQGTYDSEARIIDKGIELTNRTDKEQVKGVVYEDAFGKGIDVGALAYNSLWRKILKIDSLDNLGSIPEQAEYLEIEFEMETDFEIEGWDKQGVFEITKDIRLSDNSWLRTAKAWDSYQGIEFRDEMDENGNLVNEKTNEIPIKSEIRAKHNKMYFVKMIPIEWLKTAQFPIYSDADITYGTASEFEAGITKYISVAEIGTNKFAVGFVDNSDGDKGKARVATVSGTTITWGAVSEFEDCPENPDEVDSVSVAKLNTDKFVVAFGYTFMSTDYKARVATVIGTTITWGTASKLSSDNSHESNLSVAQLGTNKFVVGFRDEGIQEEKGKARVATVEVEGTTITWGTESEFIDTEEIDYISVAKLGTDKFVVGFRDYEHITIGYKGKARVATISGTDITWGDAASEFESGSAAYISVAQLETDKFVLGFRASNARGKARAATVDSTTITWGTEATFEAGATNYIFCVATDALHFVVTYEDDDDSDKGKSNYCSVSGTTITPGTSEVFETGLTAYTSVALISSGKIVIGFQDDGDSDKGKAIIGDTPPNTAPDAPTLSSPSNGATGQSLTLDLVFNYFDTDSNTCTKFDLKVDNDSGFTSPEINETDYSTGGSWASGGTITYSVSSGLFSSTKYYWKVRVYDGMDWSNWSIGTWDFTTLTYNKIISKGDDAYSLLIDSNLNVAAYVNNQTITTPITKKWHYVVLTYDGSTQKLYVDGILKASASLSGAITTNATNIKIGEKVPGKIDDVRVYNYARTPAQIQMDYNAGFGTHLGPSGMTCSEDPASCMDHGLVASYDFDEGDGQTLYNAADTGSVNNGTLGSSSSADSADPTWTSVGRLDSASGGDPTSSAAGPSGSALDFDGSSDYINCGNDPSLDITDAITVEAWVKPTSFQESGAVVCTGRSGGSISFYPSGTDVRFYLWTTGWHYNVIPQSDISLDEWHHFVLAYDQINLKVFMDGIEKDSDILSGNITYDGKPCVIGGYVSTNSPYTPSHYFNGTIDGVKIYNRALSAEEVRYHYNRGGPVAHWRMDEGEGSTAYDETSNNNDGTLGGGTAAYEPTWVEGKHGSALDFDGSNDYVNCGNDSSLDITDAITIEAWVKFDNSDDHYIMENYHTYMMVRYTDDKVAFRISINSVINGITTTAQLLDNVWYHLVTTRDTTNGMLIYVDGILQDTTTSHGSQNPAGSIDAGNPFYIGRYGGGGDYYLGGSIDGVKIYNYARTPAQIQMDYNAGFSTHLK